jgi:hypothetical protein
MSRSPSRFEVKTELALAINRRLSIVAGVLVSCFTFDPSGLAMKISNVS